MSDMFLEVAQRARAVVLLLMHGKICRKARPHR